MAVASLEKYDQHIDFKGFISSQRKFFHKKRGRRNADLFQVKAYQTFSFPFQPETHFILRLSAADMTVQNRGIQYGLIAMGILFCRLEMHSGVAVFP